MTSFVAGSNHDDGIDHPTGSGATAEHDGDRVFSTTLTEPPPDAAMFGVDEKPTTPDVRGVDDDWATIRSAARTACCGEFARLDPDG